MGEIDCCCKLKTVTLKIVLNARFNCCNQFEKSRKWKKKWNYQVNYDFTIHLLYNNSEIFFLSKNENISRGNFLMLSLCSCRHHSIVSHRINTLWDNSTWNDTIMINGNLFLASLGIPSHGTRVDVLIRLLNCEDQDLPTNDEKKKCHFFNFEKIVRIRLSLRKPGSSSQFCSRTRHGIQHVYRHGFQHRLSATHLKIFRNKYTKCIDKHAEYRKLSIICQHIVAWWHCSQSTIRALHERRQITLRMCVFVCDIDVSHAYACALKAMPPSNVMLACCTQHSNLTSVYELKVWLNIQKLCDGLNLNK